MTNIPWFRALALARLGQLAAGWGAGRLDGLVVGCLGRLAGMAAWPSRRSPSVPQDVPGGGLAKGRGGGFFTNQQLLQVLGSRFHFWGGGFFTEFLGFFTKNHGFFTNEHLLQVLGSRFPPNEHL